MPGLPRLHRQSGSAGFGNQDAKRNQDRAEHDIASLGQHGLQHLGHCGKPSMSVAAIAKKIMIAMVTMVAINPDAVRPSGNMPSSLIARSAPRLGRTSRISPLTHRDNDITDAQQQARTDNQRNGRNTMFSRFIAGSVIAAMSRISSAPMANGMITST